MPKLIECQYCKKMALYEESNAKRKENGQILIWHCRYCLSQVTYREKKIKLIHEVDSEKVEEFLQVEGIHETLIPPYQPIHSSNEDFLTESPPKLDNLTLKSASSKLDSIAKQSHLSRTRELEQKPNEITSLENISQELPGELVEYSKTQKSIQELTDTDSYERRIKNLLMEIKNEREQKEKLERRISFLTRRKSFMLGSGLLLISFISLIFSYVSKDLLLEGMSIGTFFFGVVLLLISSERYVKSDVATIATISPLLSLHTMLHQLNGKGPSIYLPPIQDEKIGKLFVPWESNVAVNFPSFDEVIQENVFLPEKGVLLIPVGSQLVSLIEEELGADFVRGSLKTILEVIKKTLTLKTGLVQKLDFNISGPNHIELILTGSAYSQICRSIDSDFNFCDLLGCPICSMIATLIAKTTGEPVAMKKNGYNAEKDNTSITFNLRGWTESRFRVVSRKQHSEPDMNPQKREVKESSIKNLGNLPVTENKDIWFEQKLEQGYCPLCEVPLDPKTGDCPNCGLKL